jgi:hypothetical protein
MLRSLTAMEFRVLGPFEVVEDGHTLSLGGSKQRALLACLLLRANEVVSSDRLIDEVWGESPPLQLPRRSRSTFRRCERCSGTAFSSLERRVISSRSTLPTSTFPGSRGW